jgi:hypothetical protein
MPLTTKSKMNDQPPPLAEGETSRYVLADNGLFLERRASMFHASVRVNQHRLNLTRHEEFCQLTCGTIPRVMHRAMLGFFRSAHRLHGGEAALVLLFHPERKVFRWHCPVQIIDIFQTPSGWQAGDWIEFYHPLTLPDGFLHFGDAHLHVGSPEPSSIDVRDDQDGLRIVVGTIATVPSYHVEFVVDGRRFRIQPAKVFETLPCQPFGHPPSSWIEQIRLRWNPSESVVAGTETGAG